MKKVVFGIAVFNLISVLIGFLLNVLFSRYFSLEDYGRISLLLSLIYVYNTIMEFGFNTASVIFFNKKSENYGNHEIFSFFNKIYSKYLIVSTVVLGSIIVFWLSDKYNLTSLESVYILMTSVCFSVYRYNLTFYQALGKWKRYNLQSLLYNGVKGVVFIVGFTPVLFFGKIFSYTEFLLYSLVYSGILLTSSIILSKKYLTFNSSIDKTLQREFYNILFPIAIINIIIVFAMRIDNLIIENHLGLEQLALYAAVNSLAFMFPILTGSIMKFLLREVSKEGISYLIRITEIQKKYFPFLFLGILILALTSKPLIWIVYGNKFIEAVPVFVILMASYLGGVFFTPLESYFYGFHQKTILGLKLLQLCVLIIMALVLINKFRLIGIALAVLASRLTGWVILYYKSIKEIKKLA